VRWAIADARFASRSVFDGAVVRCYKMDDTTDPVCSNCGFRPSLGEHANTRSRLYKKAKAIQKGLHEWHVFIKEVTYWFLGFVFWLNDLNDNFVRYACATVDGSTSDVSKSLLWRWTVGWFASDVPRVSPVYGWYSAVTGPLALLGVIWLSRWWFWNDTVRQCEKQEANKEFKPVPIKMLVLWLTIAWLFEWQCASWAAYALVGRNELLPRLRAPNSAAIYLWLAAILTFAYLSFKYNQDVSGTASGNVTAA